MPKRECLGCGTLTEGSSRCEPCRKAADNARYARRGTTAERGLSGFHAQVSRWFRDTDAQCVHCGQHGSDGNPMTAGHIDDRVDGGSNELANYQPECLSCNSSRGAQRP